MRTRIPHRGFTLMELMVVIAIIGLLSTVVLASLSSARAKARDSERLSELHQLQNALELYRSDHGSYPSTSNNWWGNCGSVWGNHGTSGASGWIPNLAPTYISVLPLDPKPITATNNCYLYRSNGIDYMMLAYGTVEQYSAASNPAPRPYPNQTEASFAVYTPGAVNW